MPGTLSSQALTGAISSPSEHSRREQQQYPTQALAGGLKGSAIARERERKIKVRVNALQINVTEVYWEMRALHSKSCQLSKWNYPLQ